MYQLTSGERYARLRRWHDHHLEVYFGARDLDAALATYHPEAVGYGTGRGEEGNSPEKLRGVVIGDLQSFPERIDYRTRDRSFHAVSPDVVLCQVCLDLTLDINAHRVNLRNLRHSLVARETDDGDFRICHVHVSYPTDLHGEEEPYPLKEIEEISEVVDEMVASKTRDLTTAYRKLEHMAIRDRLTGVFNRIRVDEKLEQEVRRANRYGSPIALIMLDIDDFKVVNDNHGHLSGDRVLKELARLATEMTRDTDLVGRWGGEEFIIILPETSAEQAAEIGERIREAFGETAFQSDSGAPIELSLSCGVSEFQDGDDAESVFRRADQALYEAKRAGKNRVVQKH
ncbi:diguanylate cyclase [Wenzhouxiangella sp. AB-CW3]|uniref:GGDEF domain-containing protein n=1 Tax=Wenzhouxiangella sp. AB-CW3 TaxID=2771012 RepID=UPI00168AEC09|nr:diguanylate cyclase [Wenzhouxiangella sp. AB-CW3]QOC23683.1 diguanylate cyclase [Wenzhouxiangella sp. AB-CW3]